jgi:hypothetical protein
MQRHSQLSAAFVAIMLTSFSAGLFSAGLFSASLFSTGLVLAQNAPAPATDTATPPAVAAPATTPAPAETPAPAASPAPAAALAPAAATPSAATDTKEAKLPKKKKRMTRQQEIDHAIASGTVPSRYRSSVPREYQRYIPFER